MVTNDGMSSLVQLFGTFATTEQPSKMSASNLGECAYFMRKNRFQSLEFDSTQSPAMANCKLYNKPNGDLTVEAKTSSNNVSMPVLGASLPMTQIQANLGSAVSERRFTVNIEDCEQQCSNTSGCKGIIYDTNPNHASKGNCRILTEMQIKTDELPSPTESVLVDGTIVPYTLCGKNPKRVPMLNAKTHAGCYETFANTPGVYKGAVFDNSDPDNPTCTLHDKFCKTDPYTTIKMVGAPKKIQMSVPLYDEIFLSPFVNTPHIHKMKEQPTQQDCAQSCNENPSCYAYNYVPKGTQCTFFQKTGNTDSVTFVKKQTQAVFEQSTKNTLWDDIHGKP